MSWSRGFWRTCYLHISVNVILLSEVSVAFSAPSVSCCPSDSNRFLFLNWFWCPFYLSAFALCLLHHSYFPFFFISNTWLFIRCNYSYLFNFIVKFSSFFLRNLLNPFVNILICLKNYISMQNCSCFYWFQHSFYRLFYSLLIISINIYRFQCLFRINPFFNKYFLHF